MRRINQLIGFCAALLFMAVGCDKVDDLPFYNNGSAVTISASKTSVAPTPADSNNNVLSFSWTSPNYSSDPNTYKFIVEIDSTGRNFSKKVTKEVIGNSNTVSYTGRELNAILLNYGFSLGVPVTLDARVYSSYGNNNEKYVSNVIKVAVTPYNDPAVLKADQTNVSLALATSTQKSLTFSWTNAFVGYPGTVTYSLQYDSAGKNFASPKEIAVGAAILKKDMTQGEMNETALASGIPGGNTGKVDYRVKAVTNRGAISYSNTFSVTIQSYVTILRFYMPGS